MRISLGYKSNFAFAAGALCLTGALAGTAPAPHDAAVYGADSRLLLPEGYREWVFLSSGIDMSYSPKAMAVGHSMFDNVFVNPESYRVFRETGHWPDKTVLVSETRRAQGKDSINQRGQFQAGGVMSVEIHVRDTQRFDGGWAFFDFDGTEPAREIPHSASCYVCHQQHAAVDTTFVQFYPTLLPIAEKKRTLNAGFLSDRSTGSEPRR